MTYWSSCILAGMVLILLLHAALAFGIIDAASQRLARRQDHAGRDPADDVAGRVAHAPGVEHLHGLGEAAALARLQREAVQHQLQGVLLVARQGDVLVQAADLAIDAGAQVCLLYTSPSPRDTR